MGFTSIFFFFFFSCGKTPVWGEKRLYWMHLFIILRSKWVWIYINLFVCITQPQPKPHSNNSGFPRVFYLYPNRYKWFKRKNIIVVRVYRIYLRWRTSQYQGVCPDNPHLIPGGQNFLKHNFHNCFPIKILCSNWTVLQGSRIPLIPYFENYAIKKE